MQGALENHARGWRQFFQLTLAMRIILNADDFGYSEDTLSATIGCFEHGALTSATIMPNMPATSEAIAFARNHPEFSFGVHLTFMSTGAERPLVDLSKIPDLVQENGQFQRSTTARIKALLGRISIAQIEIEAREQIDYLLDHDVPLSHVDSHGHLHKYGPFRKALSHILARYGISRVRNVQDIYLKTKPMSPTYWLGSLWRRKIREQFVTTDHFYMPASTEDRAWGNRLLQRLHGDGTLEIGVHPGREEPWRRAEAESVQAFADLLKRGTHQITSWHDIR